jgi:hypothetical protein
MENEKVQAESSRLKKKQEGKKGVQTEQQKQKEF